MIKIKQVFIMTNNTIPIAAIVLQRRFCDNCNLTYATMVKGKCFVCGMKICVHCKKVSTRRLSNGGRCNPCAAFKYRTGYDRPEYLINKPANCKHCNKYLNLDPYRSMFICNACRKRKKRNV